jgi:hypothetical protein
MNENTLNLVTAIINKDATDIEGSFNAAMAEKISARLDDMHTAVAQSMFKSEELDEEQLDELSKDTLKSYVDKAATRLVSGDKYKGMDRYNRVDGIKKATSKLVKQEEYEIDEATGMKKKKKSKTEYC